MYILGLNAYHPDSSACIIKDGRLIAAAEEERFLRVKHWSGLPVESIRYCLKEALIGPGDIGCIAISRDPYRHLPKKIIFALTSKPQPAFVKSRIRNISKIRDIKQDLCFSLGVSPRCFNAKIYNIEHHLSHIASSFFVSGWQEAAVLSIDAMGDFTSTMLGSAYDKTIDILDWICFPHSLGFLYTAATQFLGFTKFGDEFKVMGLAAYGRPNYTDKFRRIINLKRNGKFSLNPRYFRFFLGGVKMSWENQAPALEPMYSKKWIDDFGMARGAGEQLSQYHQDIAASLQAVLEEAYFHILNYLYRRVKIERLCLAGGVVLNCVANGKIFDATPFREVYIQPAASDAGTSIGAAYYVYHQILGAPRSFIMQHACWGPGFKNEEIELGLKDARINFTKYDSSELVKVIAAALARGEIVGWFQDRMELGPRALGNRSILADPRRGEMKDILNARIKHREPFRPFAPSILEEYTQEYFGRSYASPFMLLSLPVRRDKLKSIAAATHIDGSARLQTVSREYNPLFWRLIDEFRKITGVPALLNTSFNENEPIVCTPNEALECFSRARMDILVLNNYIIKR